MRVPANPSFQITDEGDAISVSLPPSERGWVVALTKGATSANNIYVVENHFHSSPPNAAGGSVSQGVSTTLSSTNLEAINAGFSSLNIQPSPPSFSSPERYRIPQAIRDAYPPFSNTRGWRGRAWVVIIRGREIGVFFDFWGHIWPLIKINPNSVIYGARWKKALDMNEALLLWVKAVREGNTERLLP